jgi:hypothetical protein
MFVIPGIFRVSSIFFLLEVNDLKRSDGYAPPDDAIQALARCLLQAIRSYFESDEGKREFAEWQSRKASEIRQSPKKSERKISNG